METVQAALETLEASDLIRPAKLEPELEYLFQHTLVQDAAYISLLKQDRRKLHLAVAEAIKSQYPNRLDELSAVLAHHFDAAEHTDQAIGWYVKAGDMAAARFANAEALSHFTRALELLPADDLVGRYDLIRKRADIYNLIGARANQREAVTALAALSERLNDPTRRAEVALKQATYSTLTGDYEAGIGAAQDAIRWAQQANAMEMETRGHLYWGIGLWRRADFEAARMQVMQALEQSRAASLVELEADCLRNLVIIAEYQGNRAEALTHAEQALPIYRRLNLRRGEAALLNSLGAIELADQRYEKARTYFEESLAVKRQLGDALGISVSLSNLGTVAHEQGDYPAAQRAFEECLALSRAIKDVEGEAGAVLGIAMVAAACGNYTHAWEAAKHSLTLSREIEDHLEELHALLCMSNLALRRDHSQEALGLAEQALSLARQIGIPERESQALIAIAQARLSLGDPPAAAASLEEVAGQSGPDELSQWRIKALSELLRMRLDAGTLAEVAPQVNTLAAYLDQHSTLVGLDVHLTCWQALEALGDPRADRVLARAHDILAVQAARFSDNQTRQSFLENVAENRAISAAWVRRAPTL